MERSTEAECGEGCGTWIRCCVQSWQGFPNNNNTPKNNVDLN
ncbi:serine/threonine-protein kinase Sid2 [Aspergillus luchuensis]|uniref:Serine/threonine-protein kinase Sid2 n=1 Tax=Aspergillus kawachii TaxID=1069201 RepID=A0A146FFB4_ASPKA|nr:serine/threonine-protein kinase Sid2 [Aspergillus luchuensis]